MLINAVRAGKKESRASGEKAKREVERSDEGIRREDKARSSITTPLPLTALIPPPLAGARLEVRRRGLEVLADVVHGVADLVAVGVHYSR